MAGQGHWLTAQSPAARRTDKYAASSARIWLGPRHAGTSVLVEAFSGMGTHIIARVASM
jgi:hypothetical protein